MLTADEISMYIDMIRAGAMCENEKLDFKLKWWDLKDFKKMDSLGTNEFLKDITAMANTPGGTGYIVVGVGEEHGTLQDAYIPMDQTYLKGIVYRRVELPFDFSVYQVNVEGKILAVIEVPPSFRRPHCIRQYFKNGRAYSNYVPIRKTTCIETAGKHDFDNMYFEKDRRAVVDYALDVRVMESTILKFLEGSELYDNIKFELPLIIINKGINVNCIIDGKIVIEGARNKELVGMSVKISGFNYKGNVYDLRYMNYIEVKSNSISRVQCYFKVTEKEFNDILGDRKNGAVKFRLEVKDVMNNVYVSNSFIIDN